MHSYIHSTYIQIRSSEQYHQQIRYLNNLKFVFDIVLMNESPYKLQHMILQLDRQSQKLGLKINLKKTKMVFNNYILDHGITIDEVIEFVQ